MKTTVLSVIGCALIAAGSLQARAQSGTNVDLNVNVALTGVTQSGDTTARVHIGTRDVIDAIATQTGNTFSTKARLLLVTPVGGDSSFVVRDGTNDFPVPGDVLGVTQVGESVGTSKSGANGLQTESDTSIQHIVLATGTLSFDVQGYTSASLSNRGQGHSVLDNTSPDKFVAKVAGTGSGPSVLQGTITGSGRKVEILP